MFDPIRALPWEQQFLIYLLAWSALITTLLPVLYLIRSMWYVTIFGRVIMAYALSLAFAVDATLFENLAYLYHWHINYWVNTWISAGCFIFISLASAFMVGVLLYMQRKDRAARAMRRQQALEDAVLHPENDA